ncbi:MAG: hypothetical protein ACLGHT_00730, partial [Acidimicrobiia bacterium]
TVRLTYTPEAGDRSVYEVRVRSRSVVRIAGPPEQKQVDEIVLRAEHEVLSADEDGSTVRVRLRPEGDSESDAREFVVRFDRAAQLAEVQEVEGLPASVLGDLGLAEIFPASAGTPPDRRLEPGERWRIVDTGDPAPAQPLSGRGRLAALDLDGEHAVGIVETVTDLPVVRTGTSAEGLFQLDGNQQTDTRTAHDLEDGSVRWSEAKTIGNYALTLTPAEEGAPSVTGSLRVSVESRTRRLS